MALSKRRKWIACIIGVVLLYVGSFLYFRLTALEMSLADADDPRSNIVMFTYNSTVHGVLKVLYQPMIQSVPGHCYYPSKAEHEKLMSVMGPKDADSEY